MPDYSKTVIYKLQHEDDESLLYVGSTTNFTHRKSQHKINTKNPNGKQYNEKLYKMIRENGGFESFKMIQIKEFHCGSRREAEKEEDKVMLELKATMNSIRAFINIDEYKEKKKKYRQKNVEKTKQYYIDNFDKINARAKQKMICECGSAIQRCEIARHLKTKKHLKLLGEIKI